MTLTFAPFLPWIVIAVLAVAALALSFIGLWRGVRGAWLRGLALAALLAAIANPLLTQEEREPLSTIVPVIVDRSQSQDVQDRPQMTDTALNALKDRLSRFPRIEPHIVEVRDDGESDRHASLPGLAGGKRHGHRRGREEHQHAGGVRPSLSVDACGEHPRHEARDRSDDGDERTGRCRPFRCHAVAREVLRDEVEQSGHG